MLTPYHSATATSHIFGKVLEQQRTHKLARYFCQKLRFSIFPCRQDLTQLRLALQNHMDILSNAIESPASLAKTFLETRKHLQIHADTIFSTISLQTNVPIDQDCLPLLILWDLSNPDRQGFSTSSRSAAALQRFCAHLTHVERQVEDYITSIRALQEVLAVFRQIQLTSILIDLEPSLPKRLYEKIETMLNLRFAEGKGGRVRLSDGFGGHSGMQNAEYES